MTWLTQLFLALQDGFLLAIKALPSDEQKLAAFKIRSPKFYARIQKQILNELYTYCKNSFYSNNYITTYGLKAADLAATKYVQLETADTAPSEQQLFIDLTIAKLHQ